MDKNEESHYEKINKFYSEYYDLLDKKNVEVALQKKRDEIIIEVCKVFYLNDKGFSYFDDEIGHEKKIENKKYSCEIVMTALNCIKVFSNKEEKHEEDFAGYTISSVNRKLNYLKAQDSVSEKNSGIKISRDKTLLVRRIKDENNHLIRLGIKNKEKREQVLQKKFNLTREELSDIMPLVLGESISLDATISDSEDGKTLGDFQESNFISAEELFENRETLCKTLQLIQEEWEKYSKKEQDYLLSDALTVDILTNMFGSSFSENEKARKSYTNEIFDTLRSFSFFNQDILLRYFSDSSYRLPTQTEIGQLHGGMTKSGVSKKVSRFYEKIRNDSLY